VRATGTGQQAHIVARPAPRDRCRRPDRRRCPHLPLRHHPPATAGSYDPGRSHPILASPTPGEPSSGWVMTPASSDPHRPSRRRLPTSRRRREWLALQDPPTGPRGPTRDGGRRRSAPSPAALRPRANLWRRATTMPRSRTDRCSASSSRSTAAGAGSGRGLDVGSPRQR